MEKEVKKYIRENANRIWKDNEDKTFHYPKVKEEYLAITKKELQRFAEIIVEDVEKLFSQELSKAREEGVRETIDEVHDYVVEEYNSYEVGDLVEYLENLEKDLSKLKE